MNDNGAKVNEIEVVKGVVYLDARSKGDDIYRLKSGDSTFLVQRDTQLRLSVDPDPARLSVFKGNVQLAGSATDGVTTVTVKQKETLTLDPTNPSLDTRSRLAPNPFPQMPGTESVRLISRPTRTTPATLVPDLATGCRTSTTTEPIFMAHGYGYVWQPYGFANSMLGWDPYSFWRVDLLSRPSGTRLLRNTLGDGCPIITVRGLS